MIVNTSILIIFIYATITAQRTTNKKYKKLTNIIKISCILIIIIQLILTIIKIQLIQQN